MIEAQLFEHFKEKLPAILAGKVSYENSIYLNTEQNDYEIVFKNVGVQIVWLAFKKGFKLGQELEQQCQQKNQGIQTAGG